MTLLNSWKPAAVISAGVFVCALMLVPSAPPASAQPPRPPQPVVVQNDASAPVPVSLSGSATVSGNVNVTNQPTVHAQQSGGWTVGATQSGAWQVEVTNPTSQRQTFNEFRRFSFPAATPPDPANQVVIPAGRVVTDIVAEGHECTLSVWIGSVSLASLLFSQPVNLPSAPLELHMTNGIAGPVTVGFSSPSGPGCSTSLLITGYEQ